MKDKYQGIANLIVLGLSFLGTFGYGIYLADQMAGSIKIQAPASLPEIKIPDPSTLAYMDFLTPYITRLSTMDHTGATVDLKLFGVRPSATEDQDVSQAMPVPANVAEPGTPFSYALTLCFASEKNSFCIIDRTLYKENSVLPDGGKIIAIENDRVRILKHNRKEWVYPYPQQGTSIEKNEEAI